MYYVIKGVNEKKALTLMSGNVRSGAAGPHATKRGKKKKYTVQNKKCDERVSRKRKKIRKGGGATRKKNCQTFLQGDRCRPGKDHRAKAKCQGKLETATWKENLYEQKEEKYHKPRGLRWEKRKEGVNRSELFKKDNSKGKEVWSDLRSQQHPGKMKGGGSQ